MSDEGGPDGKSTVERVTPDPPERSDVGFHGAHGVRLVEVDLRGHEDVLAEARVTSVVTAQISRKGEGLEIAFQGQPGGKVGVATAKAVTGPWTSQSAVRLDAQGVGSLTLGITPGESARYYRWQPE